MVLFTTFYGYTFQKRNYIGLNVVLDDILQLPIDNIIKRLLPALCFYYDGTVLHNDREQSFNGMVFPETATITVKQIQASMTHSHDYARKGTPFTNGAWRHIREQKEGYVTAYTSAGNASTNNGFLEAIPIINTDADFIELRKRQQPTLTFELLEMVLPHYLLPLDWLKSFATIHGYALNQEALEGISCLSAKKIQIERGKSLNEPFINITGDILHHRVEILSSRIQMLQDGYNAKETQLQEALATIKTLQEKLDNQSVAQNSLPKQQAREALLEKLLVNMAQESLKNNSVTFNRQSVRTTKKNILEALKSLEFSETNKNVLFSISDSTFNDFWKQQKLCLLAQGKNNDDSILLNII